MGGESCSSFIPNPLPPKPEIELAREDYDLLEKANRALGRLDGITDLLPDPWLFIYFYVRKEAVLSSQIEGTQSSLSELLLFENEVLEGVSLDEVLEVSNYVSAMNHGLERIKRDGFPLSSRLIREIHQALLARGRGSDKDPGSFRQSQNWIGGTRPGNARFVPPPPEVLPELMSNLEKFLHNVPEETPVLMKAALAHVQFETIHPFLDGNGRVGRLLITLLLCAEQVLREPLLYLSYYFKLHRDEYYERLQRVRVDSDWISWLRFFLVGVRETAQQAFQTAVEIRKLFEQNQLEIERSMKRPGNVHRVHELLQRNPYLSISVASTTLRLSEPTVRTAINHLTSIGIVREITGRKRNRVYGYDAYLKILAEGTEPLP